MDYYCVNHTQEKAVGLCATCQRPACYRCSLNVNQDIYCSLECFNKLSPPSAVDVPAMRAEAAVPAEAVPEAAKLDEFSDMIASLNDQSEIVMPAAAADEPSVILKSSQAVDPTTILGMAPVQVPPRDGSTLILIPGTRRAVMSSSCYFHPDTSAIVLCSKCRSPICSLCAKETPEGLCCTPDCGPADPVGDRERSNSLLFNIGLGVAIFLVFVGAVVIFASALQTEPTLALKPAAAAEPAPASAPEEPKAATPEPPPAETPKPPVSPVERPEPVKADPPPAKVATPPPVKIETPKPAVSPVERPEPPPPPVIEQPKPEPVAKIVTVAAVLPPPPPPPVKESTQLELDLRCAAALLREARPLLADVADAMHPEWKPDVDLAALASKLTTVDIKLKQAREIYALRKKDAPDPALLVRRIDTITQVLEALQSGFDQIRERHKVVGKWPKRS